MTRERVSYSDPSILVFILHFSWQSTAPDHKPNL
jgi:hypothetical protein